MLRSLKGLKGLTVSASDGEIGHVADFYFDDDEWIVRYFVIETGNWLFERQVLISPAAVLNVDWSRRAVSVSLSKEKIENSPRIDHDKPVSRQKELELAQYYTWPTYWPIGDVGVPMDDAAIASTLEMRRNESGDDDQHLRSEEEVTGYTVQATDGSAGTVNDLIVDDENWTVQYLVVSTHKILPGKKILIAPVWAEMISWASETIHVDIDEETLKSGPEFVPSEPVNREIEERMFDYYGRPQNTK